ncbi:hypothetical protein Tco_0625695 [Tanacetum coccineum]|uniref:MAK10-like protein n=1 Tax=Tanacetum coccineum TaxID=301880 RepID=A0ABQ4WHH1_9ASTR
MQEDPRSSHSKNIVVENLVKLVENYYRSFDQNTGSDCKQTELEANNHNHNEHRFHITYKYSSRTGVVEGNHVNPITRRTIDQSAGGKLHDHNAKESRALLEDLALYDNKSWNDPRDFAKPVKVIALPQDVPSTSDRCLIELENQVQRLMEAHLALTQPTQVNKITTSYARLSKFEADFKQQQSEMTNKIDTLLKAITDLIAATLPSDTVKNPKLSVTPVLSARSYPTIDP